MSPPPFVQEHGSRMLDATLRALGDPTRREILKALRAGDLAAGEIAARFPMTAASVSHHLSVLKDAGLVTAERNGRNLIYSLETTVFQEFLQEMMGFLGKGEG
jgi:DNA-binding transcriptional ArsR family regulator